MFPHLFLAGAEVEKARPVDRLNLSKAHKYVGPRPWGATDRVNTGAHKSVSKYLARVVLDPIPR